MERNCNHSGNEEKLSQSIRWQHLIALVCKQAITQFLIFLRGQRLNAHSYVGRKFPTTPTVANRTFQRRGTHLKQDDMLKNMPNEKMLNDIKLERDLDELIRIYTASFDELTKEEVSPIEKVNQTLYASIEQLQQASSDEEKLLKELQQNQFVLKSLRIEMEKECTEAEERLKQKDEHISTVRHKLRYVRRVNDLEYHLVEKWEANRCMQCEIVCERAERALGEQIDTLARRLRGEQCIIREVQNFNKKQFENLHEQIEYWKQRYAKEMRSQEAEMREREQRIIDVRKTYERHHERYEQRTRVVDEYMAIKAEERRLFELEMHRIECAVRLQAWWRGVMVRRGLGPYRKKSKKGKRGKGKSK